MTNTVVKSWYRVEFFGGTETAVKASDEIEAYIQAPSLADQHVVVARVYSSSGELVMDRTQR